MSKHGNTYRVVNSHGHVVTTFQVEEHERRSHPVRNFFLIMAVAVAIGGVLAWNSPPAREWLADQLSPRATASPSAN